MLGALYDALWLLAVGSVLVGVGVLVELTGCLVRLAAASIQLRWKLRGLRRELQAAREALADAERHRHDVLVKHASLRAELHHLQRAMAERRSL